MHLVSSNGAIDVLVCPEADDNESPNATPVKEDTGSSPTHHDQDVSLSSMASHDADLDGLMASFPQLVHPLSEPNYMPFETLSPPLNEDDFYSTLSPTEGILELFDLA